MILKNDPFVARKTKGERKEKETEEKRIPILNSKRISATRRTVEVTYKSARKCPRNM